MVNDISIFSICLLGYSSKRKCQLTTLDIFLIAGMFYVLIHKVLSCPCKHSSIDLTPISLSLHILAYPEAKIHTMFFRAIETNTSYQFASCFIEDKIFKEFLSCDCLLYLLYICIFLVICGHHGTNPKISIRNTELFLKFTDIHSSISRKWDKNASVGFDMRGGEIEMRVFEKHSFREKKFRIHHFRYNTLPFG